MRNDKNTTYLVPGPVGSGKTTTLYAALTQLGKDAQNIIVIDPVGEYYNPNMDQSQDDEKQ